MPVLPPEVSARAARRWGVFTLEEVVDFGWKPEHVHRQVRAGALTSIHNGVYRAASTPDSFESRCVAACLADPEAVVTGASAARLWDFRHVFRPAVPDVLVSHDRTPLTRGVKLRRTNVLEAEDRIEREDGIRVAAPSRAWFDCARDVDDVRFERLTEWVLDRHCSVPQLWRMLRRLEARGRPGLARARRVMSQRADWQRPAGSGLELDVLNALEQRGVRPLVRQHAIRLLNGSVIHADGAVPEVRWAVEVDHVTWHGGRFDAQRDKARDRQARRVGWQVDRMTDQELRESFDRAITELVEMFQLRCEELHAA